MTKRLGFTLAEVLITLGIIGVVAAMTIPTLMNQTGGAEYKTGYKKMISVLNQVITMNIALNGDDFSTLVSTPTTGAQSVYFMFVNRMNTMANPSGAASIGGPFANAANYTLFFNDGMAITFPTAMNRCTAANQTGCQIVVDMNGVKRPNALSTATDETTGTNGIKDQMVIDCFGQEVLPYKTRGQYVLYR